jgi:hypothetical protein
MSAAERVFAERFSELVLAKRPILVMPDRRSSIVDAHHTISRSWMESRLSGLEDEERWAILWDPDCGVPAERPRHEQITNAHKRVQPSELRVENIEFAAKHGWLDRLSREVPGYMVEHA